MARTSYKNTRYLLAQDIRDFSYLALDLAREGGVPAQFFLGLTISTIMESAVTPCTEGDQILFGVIT